MKTFAMTLLLAAVTSSLACIPEEVRTFTVETESDPVTVPAMPIVGQNPLAPDQIFPADFGSLMGDSLNQEFSTEGVESAAVSSLKLTSMRVEVLDPTTPNGTVVRDLSFVDSLTFAIGGDGVAAEQVAYSADDAFGDEVIEYDFEMTGQELKPALDTGALVMEAELSTNDYPNFETDIVFHTELTVVVDPLGAL